MTTALLSLLGLAFSVLVGWRIAVIGRRAEQRQTDIEFVPKAWARIDLLDARLTQTQTDLHTTNVELTKALAELGDLRAGIHDATQRLAAAGAFIDALAAALADADVRLPQIPDFPAVLHRVADPRPWRTLKQTEEDTQILGMEIGTWAI